MQNPDLLQPQNGVSTTVAPIAAITRPLGTTKADPVYFISSMSVVSFHRPDGKRIAFVNGVHKAEIQEDINYLREQIEKYQNPYVREATPDEVSNVKMKENPVEAIKAAVRSEIEQSYSLDDLQRLIEERKKTAAAAANGDGAKISGVDKPNALAGAVKAVSTSAGHQHHAAHTGVTTASLAAGLP